MVGFGNSGGEIALDLAEHGRAVDLAVRSPVNLLPRELLGRPITSYDLLRRVMPYRWADAVTAPLLRLAVGDHARYGLRRATKGPLAQIVEDGTIPVIDIGALAAIREGRITVRPGLDGIDGPRVRFAGGAAAEYDAILLATGYRVDLRGLLADAPGVLDPEGRPLASGGEAAAPGLYLMGYNSVPNGQLRAIGAQARAIAADVAGRRAAG